MSESFSIAYVANARIPTEKAHGYQIVRVCSALSDAGASVALYIPQRDNHIAKSAFTYYGVKENFDIHVVPSIHMMRLVRFLGGAAHVLQGFVFALKLIISRVLPKTTIIYSRDPEVLFCFGLAGYTTVYNAHSWTTRSSVRKFLLRRVTGVVCNSEGTGEAVRRNLGVPVEVIHHGVDPNPYVGADKHVLRTELGLPTDTFIALYTGHLYPWKGSEVLFAAARELGAGVQIVVVGGEEHTVTQYQKRAREAGVDDRITYLGHQAKEYIPKYLAAADVLVLPNSAITTESVEYTAPLKLFEYLAAGVPIIASDVPSIRRLLPDTCCMFVAPDDPMALRNAITDLATGTITLNETAGLEESKQYTWNTHAVALTEFLRSRSS